MVSTPINNPNLVIVISGPSGCGKSTVAKALCEVDSSLRLSVSATTRTARKGEIDSVNYHFLSKTQFEEKIRQNAFLEWAEYHNNFYGTLRSEIEVSCKEQKDTILEIEVNGALQVQKQNLSTARIILIFLLPTSFAILEKRLRGRKTESEEDLKNRLEIAKTELSQIIHYDYYVVNPENEVAQAVQQIQTIISAERCRINPEKASDLVESFGMHSMQEL